MKKRKSEHKKIKKELEHKLTIAVTAIVADYGKAKKCKSIVQKFAKQLYKKIDLKTKAVIVNKEVEFVAE